MKNSFNFTPNAAGSDIQRRVRLPEKFLDQLHVIGDNDEDLPLAVLFISTGDLRWFQLAAAWASDGLGRLAIVVSVKLGHFARCVMLLQQCLGKI